MIWAAIALVAVVPILIAAFSPYLASRNPAYIIASFGGIICLVLFLVQPLLAAGYVPHVTPRRARRWHGWLGGLILVGMLAHVGGLYLTSPPDAIDALLLRSPTPFSIFGVVALWALLVAGVLVALRRKLGLKYPRWHVIHNVLVLSAVVATVIHALQIEGTMGVVSKLVLCGAVLMAALIALVDVRWMRR